MTVELHMSPGVVELLLRVVDDVEALVADPGQAGGDVARRLVPEAHRDDPEAEADYRRVVGPQLREERTEAAAVMRTCLLRTLTVETVDDPTGSVTRAASLAESVGLGRDARVLVDLWSESPDDDDVRRRVAANLARLCDRGVTVARKRSEDDLAASLAAGADAMRALAGSVGSADVVHLDPEEVAAWMITVNHARLAIGTACGVSEDMDDWDPADPRAAQLGVYSLLTALLDHLVEQSE
ncbi:MAG: DUF2017 family protein [Acidimicrobiia bacterium]